MKRLALALAALLAAAAASCVAPPSPPATPTLPGVATATPTVAFPTVVPTPTWTPGPTPTPTAELRPSIGPAILRDGFDDPSAWDVETTSGGGAAITDGRLTLSVRTPRTYHGAQRPQPVVAGFYAEIDVFTEVCNPGDEIGLTARGDPGGEQYRFLIGCDGTARITRVLEDGSRALTLRVESPSVLAGAPARNHLAVWARGLDLRMFVNGSEVLSARDAALATGFFGVIARAGTGGQVSASFDDLIVYVLQDPTAAPAEASSAGGPQTTSTPLP